MRSTPSRSHPSSRATFALVLDGHASHTTFDAISLAISLDIDLFQLPSHTSHITQPFVVGTFGTFKKELTRVLTAYPLKIGGRRPVKRDMAGGIAEAWSGSFTPANNMAAFKGAGLWPVNMEKAINRLHGKRKQRENVSPIPEHLAVVASKRQFEEDLGRVSLLELKRQGVMIEGLRVNTVRRREEWGAGRGKGRGAGRDESEGWAKRCADGGRGGAAVVGVRKDETGAASDRVTGAAPLVLVEREGGLVGGWGPVLASKEERDGREGRWFPRFSRRRRRPLFPLEDGNEPRHQSLMCRLDAVRLSFFHSSIG
ncbi:unnamed protein product [Ectocarpus sp. CCAP 1310/34]|nr:unnamed protein product [Ectocarpus sp. CCAP 1310/34]